MLKRILSVILVIIWLLVIYSFSDTVGIISGNQTRSMFHNLISKTSRFLYGINILNQEFTEDTISETVEEYHPIFRKLCHLFVYFMLGIFSYLSIIVIFGKGTLFSSILTIFFSLGYSIFDELHQASVPSRTCTPMDVAIDTLGAIIACILVSTIVHYRRKKKTT